MMKAKTMKAKKIKLIKPTINNITNNRIKIQTTCQDVPKGCIVEPINPLQDTQVIVNLVIDYDISCVSC